MPRHKDWLPTVSRQFLTRNYRRPNCLLKWLPNFGACSTTTKFLDNKISTFNILLSWRSHEKQCFARFSSLPPRPPPTQKASTLFFTSSCRFWKLPLPHKRGFVRQELSQGLPRNIKMPGKILGERQRAVFQVIFKTEYSSQGICWKLPVKCGKQLIEEEKRPIKANGLFFVGAPDRGRQEGVSPICSDLLRFLPICSDLFSEQSRTKQGNLRPFNPPRGVLEPFGPKVGNGVENEFAGPEGPGAQKVKNRVEKESKKLKKGWNFHFSTLFGRCF